MRVFIWTLLGKEEKDKKKTIELEEKGYKVIRIRSFQLGSISKSDIVCNQKDYRDHLPIIHRVLNNLQVHLSLSSDDETKVKEYLALNKFQNDKDYKIRLSALPGPIPEKSLLHLHPKLCQEWYYEKNDPLKPALFSAGSKQKVWWQCKEGHEWKAAIGDRASGQGCLKCYCIRRGKERDALGRYRKTH